MNIKFPSHDTWHASHPDHPIKLEWLNPIWRWRAKLALQTISIMVSRYKMPVSPVPSNEFRNEICFLLSHPAKTALFTFKGSPCRWQVQAGGRQVPKANLQLPSAQNPVSELLDLRLQRHIIQKMGLPVGCKASPCLDLAWERHPFHFHPEQLLMLLSDLF